MGLDVKEKNLLKFILKILTPSLLSLYILRSYVFSDSYLEFVGFLFLAFQGFKVVIKPIYSKIFRRPKNPKSYGEWAIVTGCTSGIGLAYAHDLAKKGFNLVLISRTMSKLEDVANDVIEDAKCSGFRIETKCLAHDFGTDDGNGSRKFYADLDACLKTLSSIGILVNCVGLSNDLPALTHLISPHDVTQMLNVNNNGTLHMTRSVLPFMYARKSGAVITVSSASCTHPTPLLSVYSSTKAFGNQLTRSMYYEYKEHGIDCLSLTPYYFISNMFKRSKSSFIAPFPDVIIDGGWKALGYEPEIYPYTGHWVLGVVGKWHWEVGDGLLTVMKNVKKRADDKIEREKSKKVEGKEE